MKTRTLVTAAAALAVGLLLAQPAAGSTLCNGRENNYWAEFTYGGDCWGPNHGGNLMDELLQSLSRLERQVTGGLNQTHIMYNDQVRVNVALEQLINATELTIIQWDWNAEFVEAYKNVLDAATLCSAAMFLLLCKLGMMMRHVGMVTNKSTKLTVITDIISMAVIANVWWMFGYGIAYGHDNYVEENENGLVGTSHYMGDMPMPDDSDAGDVYARFAMCLAFAYVCGSIPVGVLAERTSLSASVIYTMVLGGIFFPIAVHSVWNADGWTSSGRTENLSFNCGAVDHLGSNVVHVTGGVFGAVGALLVGPRAGRWLPATRGQPKRLGGKNPAFPVLEALGALVFLLSQVAAACLASPLFVLNPQDGVKASINTLIGATSASVTSIMIGVFFTGVISPELASSGVLAGCVAIAAGAEVVSPEGAVVIGYGAAWTMYVGAQILLRLHIDDCVNAVPIHLFCGVWGCLAVGLFSKHHVDIWWDEENGVWGDDIGVSDTGDDCNGSFYSGNVDQLKAQFMMVAYNLLFSTMGAAGTFLLLPKRRYPHQWETAGVDYHHMGGGANIIPMAVEGDSRRRSIGILTGTNFGVDLDGDGRAG